MRLNMWTKIIQGLLVGWITLSNLGCCLYVGDICTDRNSSGIGRCKLINECSTAIRGFRNGTIPANCGFEKNVPIVCCINETSSSLDASTISTIDNAHSLTTQKTTRSTITEPTDHTFSIGFGAEDNDRQTTRENTYRPKTQKTTTTTSIITVPTNPTYSVGLGAEGAKKSLKKCDEYAKYVFEITNSPILLMDNEKVVVDTCNVKEMILDSVRQREMPHLALIGFNTSAGIAWKCGGSLISNNYILTSASCVFSQQHGYARFVRLGGASVFDTEETNYRQNFDILEITKHPKYNASTRSNDIALIKLLQNVTLNSYVRPACVTAKAVEEGQKLIAAGWGSLSHDGNINVHPFKTVLTVIDKDTYGNAYDRFDDGAIENMHFCAKPKTQHLCVGDLGGSATVFADQYCTYNIIGVTTSWKKCGVDDSPAIYTSISPYIKWIEENVWT